VKDIAVHFFSLKECASLERDLQSLRRHARAESLRGAALHGSMGVYVSQCYKRGRHVCATSKSLSLKGTSIQAVWRSSALIVVCTSVLVLSPLLRQPGAFARRRQDEAYVCFGTCQRSGAPTSALHAVGVPPQHARDIQSVEPRAL